MAQNTITQVIDDRGPGIAFFSSSASWNRESNPLEFDQTATWTETAGDSVTVSFNGTSIIVFCTLDSTDFPPVQASYQVDNAPTIRLTNSSFLGETQFQQMFYQSPVLNSGVHTLTITNLVNGSTFRFDFVKVISPNPVLQTVLRPPPSSTSSQISLTSTTQDSASDTSASSSTDSPDSITISPMTLAQQPSSLPASSFLPSTTTVDSITDGASSTDAGSSSTALSSSGGTSNGTHLAAILGGILGGLGLLVWIIVFFIIQRRRRQRINRTRRMSEFLRKNSEKRSYQSNFSPVRRHDSQDMSSFGTPDPIQAHAQTSSVSSSSSVVDQGPPSTYELTPFTGQPTPERERPPERSVWSPDLPAGRQGKKKGYYYPDSPPKYNSGQFYHLES